MVSASAILGELNGSCKQDFHVRTYSLPAGLACIRFGWPLIDYRFMFENMENSDDDHELRPSGPSRVKARRSHKKSRNGCRYCKQRRIKCDEAQPACGNCVRSEIPCEYSPYSKNPYPIISRRRGRPRKDWSAISAETDQNDAELSASSSTLSQPLSVFAPRSELSLDAPLHMPWSVTDLELFYHYITVVATGGQDNHLWQTQVPRLAFRHHSVLHLILAISSLHLARFEPNRTAELVAQAEAHMAIGLRQTTHALSSLNEDNCAEIYIATILICTYTFAKQPGPRHLLVIAEGHEVAWWELFRGVRIVVDRVGIPKIFAKIAKDVELETFPQSMDQSTGQKIRDFIIFGPMEWEIALSSLSCVIEHAPAGRRDVCQKTLDMLKWCYIDTFGTSANPKSAADAKFQTIMAWLYVLDDEYVNMLKGNETVALVILAHFAVLLQTLESVWFLEGWALHILHGISEILGDSPQAQWIRWPTLQVQSGATFVREMQLARRRV